VGTVQFGEIVVEVRDFGVSWNPGLDEFEFMIIVTAVRSLKEQTALAY
jgi:hypothetical protein